MVKKIYLCLLICIPCLLHAQREKPPRQPDSLFIYQLRLDSLRRTALDSLSKTPEYAAALQNVARLSRDPNGYAAFTVLLEAFHSDYGALNEVLVKEGFSALEETTLRIGMGTGFRFDRALVDFYYGVLGLKSVSKKQNEDVTAGLSNFFTLDVGYSLLKNPYWSIYPYGGLSLRISKLRFRKHPTENPGYTSILDMLSDGQTTKLESTRIGYQLGMGIDVPLFGNKENDMKGILFVKAGTNGPLWKDRYAYRELRDYDPGLKQGIWTIAFGIKLAGSFDGAPRPVSR